ncbi:relaxase domain-containing protein [Streptomyces cyaneofuscatus]|uniref:relaxase domain-containing protein n=1 Tax=Streptomyces cyaneofuscatus TaxID=66883 RepID=UPI0036663C43
MTVTGVDFVFRPQPSIYLLWALGDEEARRAVEAAHGRAIVRVLERIGDEVAVIRYGRDGIYRVWPPGGLVAARFHHDEARSGRPLKPLAGEHDPAALHIRLPHLEPLGHVLSASGQDFATTAVLSRSARWARRGG